MEPTEPTQPQTPEDRDAQIKRDIIAGLQSGGMDLRAAPAFNFEEEEKPDVAAQTDPSLLTGKDIYEYMQMNRKARFSHDEMGRKSFRMMMEYMDTKKSDFMGSAENALSTMVEELGGLADAPLNPVKFAASTAEGAAKGIQDMYGIFAQSEDPGSWGFKLKSYFMRLAGKDDGDVDSQIRQFHEARDFNNRSYEHMEGKGTILGDYMPEGWRKTYEGLVDSKFATAMSYAVLDIPEWFFSAGSSTPSTALKLAATGAAKSRQATWAARAVERLGGYGTNLLGKNLDLAAGKSLEAAGTIIRAPFKAIYGSSAAAAQLAGDYAGNAVRNASTAAAVEMGAEIVGNGIRHPAMGFMRSIGLEALGELAQTAGADIVDRALGKAMVKPDAIGMTTLERLASGTARGAETMSREAQMLAVGLNASVGWSTSMSSSALKAMFRDGLIGAGIGYYNSREEGAGAGVGMGVAWGGLSGTVRHMGAYTRFQHQDQLLVDNFKGYGIEAFRRVLGTTGYESAKRFTEHVESFGDLRTSAIEMAHLQTLIAHEGNLMGVGNVNFYFGDVSKNPSELMQVLVDMKMPASEIVKTIEGVKNNPGMMADFKDVNNANKKVLILNSEQYRPTTGRHEVAHLLLRSVAEANGDMELIGDAAGNKFKIFRPNYLLNLLGASKDMGAMPDKAWNAMIQSYTALYAMATEGLDEAGAKARGMQMANAVETYREAYNNGQLKLQDPDVAYFVAQISRVAEEAFAYYQGGLSNVLPVDQYTKDPAARNMLRAWAENRAARKNSLIMADLELAGVEIRSRLTNPDGSPKLFSDQKDAHGNPIPVFDSFLFDDGKMLRTPGMDSWIDMVMRQAYSKGEVLTSTMDPFRQEALAKSAGKTHLFSSVAGGGMRLKSPKELDEMSSEQAKKILGAAGSVPEDVRPFVEVDQEGATKIKLESIGAEALEAIRQSGAFTKQEWDAIAGMINIVQRNRQGSMHNNVLNATLLAHTMQVRKGASVIRLTGKDVPVTYRSFVPLSVEVYVKTHDAQGNPLRSPKGGVLIHSLDIAAENRRLQRVFKRADVQQLFGGDFDKFVKTFNAYVINQSGLNGARVPTADLLRPIYGPDAERVRDILYEAFGGRKTKDSAWINEPGNGYRGGADDPNRPFFTMRFDTMADIQVQPTAWNPYSRVPFFPYIHNVAYEGITKNFQLSGFAASPLANGGMMLRNRQGFEIYESKKGYTLFDPFGIKVGVFKTAAKAMKKAAKDAGELDEADTIPGNSTFHTPEGPSEMEPSAYLSSTMMLGGRSGQIAAKLSAGRSARGMSPVEYVAALARTNPKASFDASPVSSSSSPNVFHPTNNAGVGLVNLPPIVAPDGTVIIDKAVPKKFIRMDEAFGSAALNLDGIDIPAEQAILSADGTTPTAMPGGDMINIAMSFSPAHVRGLVSLHGLDFANAAFSNRAATSLVVATAVRNGSIPIPSTSGAGNASHAMALASLMGQRDASGTSIHEGYVDDFVSKKQIDVLGDMATKVAGGNVGAYDLDKIGNYKDQKPNPAFLKSALSIRATFGTLDWAKGIVKSVQSGKTPSTAQVAAARAILSAVEGKATQTGSPARMQLTRVANLDFARAYTEAKMVYGTEQNAPLAGGAAGGQWIFSAPDNPDHVIMFNDAMVDLSDVDPSVSSYQAALVVREIEAHHAKFMQAVKASGSKIPVFDEGSVRTSWISGLNDLIPGLSDAFTDIIINPKRSPRPSARVQTFLDAWRDSANRTASNGGIFKKTVIGKFGTNGKLELAKTGSKIGFAWMSLDNVNDPDVDNVLTHRSIYEGIEDAINRHAVGDPNAIVDAAVLYGVISSLTSDGNPFFHLIKPTYERTLAGGVKDTFNRTTFSSVRDQRYGKYNTSAGYPSRPYSKPATSIYDLPASRAYVTKRSTKALKAADASAPMYLEASVNSADPSRYRSVARDNAIIGSSISPIVVRTKGTNPVLQGGAASMVVHSKSASVMWYAGTKNPGHMTMIPESLGADNLITGGTVMDPAGQTSSPAFLSIAMESMDAAGNFDFSKKIARVDKDVGEWLGMYSNLGNNSRNFVDQITKSIREGLDQAAGDTDKVGLVYASLTKALIDVGVSHDQAMFAERMIIERIKLQDAVRSSGVGSAEALNSLASISDAILQSEEARAGGPRIGGLSKNKIESYTAMLKEYRKTGEFQLGSKEVAKGKTIEGDNLLMLSGRKAEAYLSKERKEMLIAMGLMGKLKDSAGNIHTYFEISDARAKLNTATFANGLAGVLTEGLPDAEAAIEGALLSRIGRANTVDLQSLIDNFNSRNLKLKDLLIHDELYALYPQLPEMKVTCTRGLGASFNPAGDKGFQIGVDNLLRQEYASRLDIDSSSARAGEGMGHEGHGEFPSYEELLRDTLLHEVQHAIQNAEDWRDIAFQADAGIRSMTTDPTAPVFSDAQNPSGYLTPFYVGAAKALGSDENIGIMGPFEDDGTLSSDVVRILKKHFADHDKLANVVIRNTGAAGIRESIGYAGTDDVVRAIKAIIESPLAKTLVADEIPSVVRIAERYATAIDLFEFALSNRASEFDDTARANMAAKLRANRVAVMNMRAAAMASLERVKEGSDPLVEASALAGVVRDLQPSMIIKDPSLSILAKDVVGNMDYLTYVQEVAVRPLTRSLSKLALAAHNGPSSLSPLQANLRIAEVVHGLMGALYMQDPMEISARETEARSKMSLEQLAKLPRKTTEDIVKMPEALRIGLFARSVAMSDMGMEMSPGMFDEFKNDNLLMIGGSKGSQKLSSEVLTSQSAVYELGLRYMARASLLSHLIKPDDIIKRANELAYKSRGWKITPEGKAVYVVSEGLLSISREGVSGRDVVFNLMNTLDTTAGQPRRDRAIRNDTDQRIQRIEAGKNKDARSRAMSGIVGPNPENLSLQDIEKMGSAFGRVADAEYYRDNDSSGDAGVLFAAGLSKDGTSVTIEDIADAIGAAIKVESEMTMGSPALDAVMSSNFPDFFLGENLVQMLRTAGVDEQSILSSRADEISKSFANKRVSKSEVADLMAIMHDVPFADYANDVTNREQVLMSVGKLDEELPEKIRAAYFEDGDMGKFIRSTVHTILNSRTTSGDEPLKYMFDSDTALSGGSGIMRLHNVVTTVITQHWNMIEGLYNLTGNRSVAEKLLKRLTDRYPTARDVSPSFHSNRVVFQKSVTMAGGGIDRDTAANMMRKAFTNRLSKLLMALTPLAERVAELSRADETTATLKLLEHIYGKVIDETLQHVERMRMSADDSGGVISGYSALVGRHIGMGGGSYSITDKSRATFQKLAERTLGGTRVSRMSGTLPLVGLYGGATHLMRLSSRVDNVFMSTAGVALQGQGGFVSDSGRSSNLISNQTAGETELRLMLESRPDVTRILEESADLADEADLTAARLIVSKMGDMVTAGSEDMVENHAPMIVSVMRAHRRLRQMAKGVMAAIDTQGNYLGVGSQLRPSKMISYYGNVFLSDQTAALINKTIADDQVGMELTLHHLQDQREKATALLELMRSMEDQPGVLQNFGTIMTESFGDTYHTAADVNNARRLTNLSTLRTYVPKDGEKRLVITSAHESLMSAAEEKDITILSGMDTTSMNSPAFASGRYAANDYTVSANLFGDMPGEPIGTALERTSSVLAKALDTSQMRDIQFADQVARTMRSFKGQTSMSYKQNSIGRSMIHVAGGGFGLYGAADQLSKSNDAKLRALGEALRSFDHEVGVDYETDLASSLLAGLMVPLLKRLSDRESLYDAKADIAFLVDAFSKDKANWSGNLDDFVLSCQNAMSRSNGIGIRRLGQYMSVRFSSADWQGMARAAGAVMFDRHISLGLATKFTADEIKAIRREYMKTLASNKADTPEYESYHRQRSQAGELPYTREVLLEEGQGLSKGTKISESKSALYAMNNLIEQVLGTSDHGSGSALFFAVLGGLTDHEGVKHSPAAIKTDDGWKVAPSGFSQNADSSARDIAYGSVTADEVFVEGPSGFSEASGASIYEKGSLFSSGEVMTADRGGIAMALMTHPEMESYLSVVRSQGVPVTTSFKPARHPRLTKDIVRTHIRKSIAARLRDSGTDVIEIQPASMSLSYRAPSAAMLIGMRGMDTIKEAVKDWNGSGIRSIDRSIQYKTGTQKGNYIAAGEKGLSLVEGMYGDIGAMAESRPSRGFSWTRAANGDILVNISGDHLGYKLDARGQGKKMGFGFSLTEGVGFDGTRGIFIPAKGGVQSAIRHIMGTYGHFMGDAYDTGSSSMKAAYIRADERMGGRIHRSRIDGAGKDIAIAAKEVVSPSVGPKTDLTRAASRLALGQSAGYVTIRIPANSNMETIRQMLLTAHMDPTITPNYGLAANTGRLDNITLHEMSVGNGGIMSPIQDQSGSYSRSIKHKIRTEGNSILDSDQDAKSLIDSLTRIKSQIDPHVVEDIELLVAKIVGKESGYFLPDAERKLALDGDTGMAIASLFPGREDLLKYSWDAKARHGIKVWKRTGPKGDANFRAHVVQFDTPVSISPEGGLQISKTAFAFKTAAEAEQYANQVSRMMSGAEMVKALADGDIEVVDRPDLAKANDDFIGDVEPRKLSMLGEEGIVQSENGYTVGDLDSVFDKKTASQMSKVLGSRKHVRFKSSNLLMIGSRSMDELESLVKSKLNFGLPKGPIRFASKAMNAISRGLDNHKRHRDVMSGADWFAFMKTNGVSGEEIRQSGLGQLFSTSLETPLSRMDVAEFLAAMMPNLVKNDFKFSPYQRAIEAMTMDIPSSPQNPAPAFLQSSGWHVPYIQNAAIQTVANMKMSIDAVRGPVSELSNRLKAAVDANNEPAVAKLKAAINVISDALISAAGRLGIPEDRVVDMMRGGLGMADVVEAMNEQLKQRLREATSETSTSSDIAKLANDLDFTGVESVRQKYNDEVAKMMKDAALLEALSGVAPEIYAPLRLMKHGWIGATNPSLGALSTTIGGSGEIPKNMWFGSGYTELMGQTLGTRKEGWATYSTGKQETGTNTAVQYYSPAIRDQISQYIADLGEQALAAEQAGDLQKADAARKLRDAAKRVATVREALSGAPYGSAGSHFGNYLPSGDVTPAGGEYEIGHYRYSLNLALSGLSVPLFDKPEALLIGAKEAGLPMEVRLDKLGYPVMMLEEFQSDLFQRYGGTGVVEEADAFLPASAEEAVRMQSVPAIKEKKERMASLTAIRDNMAKHLLESLMDVTDDKSFTDLTIRLQLNNLDLMNKMFITASCPGLFRGTGRYVKTPETLIASIKKQAGFTLPERMLVVEPDVELIKIGMGGELSEASWQKVSDRMIRNMRSAEDVHVLFREGGMNMDQIVQAVMRHPRRSLEQSMRSISQLMAKANTDMLSENYLLKILPNVENAPNGDLKQLLLGLAERIQQRGTSGGAEGSANLLAAQLAAMVLLDEKYVLDISKAVQDGSKIDYEAVARRTLETIRAKFADSRSFNGKTVLTAFEVMLMQASEPKPFLGAENNFSAGTGIGHAELGSLIAAAEIPEADLADVENISINQLNEYLGLTMRQRERMVGEIAESISMGGDLSKKAIYISRGPSVDDVGPQRSYVTIRTTNLEPMQLANRVVLEMLKAKKEGRAIRSIVVADYNRYSGTQAGAFVRSISELFVAMAKKESLTPEIDKLGSEIAELSKGVPEIGSLKGAQKHGSSAVLPNSLPLVDINGYKSAHLSMAVIDSMNHGMRGVGLYDASFQLERGHGLDNDPTTYIGFGKNNRYVFALDDKLAFKPIQALLYTYEKLLGEYNGQDGPHGGFLYRLANLDEEDVIRLKSGSTIDHNGVTGTLGKHMAIFMKDMSERIPDGMVETIKTSYDTNVSFEMGGRLLSRFEQSIDKSLKRNLTSSLSGPAFVGGKKVENVLWEGGTKFNANAMKDSVLTLMPAQAHGSAGWGYLTNYGLPGWKVDLMMTGASRAFRDNYSLDAFDRPKFEVRGSNMVLLDPKTGRELVTVDVTSEQGMRIFREKYLQASKYRGGNWAIRAFMKEWGAAGAYIDTTVLADLPNYRGEVSGYKLDVDSGMPSYISNLSALSRQNDDPRVSAIIRATQEGKLSPEGFNNPPGFGGFRISPQEGGMIIGQAGGSYNPETPISSSGNYINAESEPGAGSFRGQQLSAERSEAQPTASSLTQNGAVHPAVYAAVLGGGVATPEAVASMIIKMRNTTVTTMVHTPEMRTKEHELAFRTKVSSGIHLLMASGRKAEPGKPVDPNIISALAQLAEKVEAMGQLSNRRRSESVEDTRYRDLRDNTPITYADNLMVDRSQLPKLPMAEKPAEIDPNDKRFRIYDRDKAVGLLKAGHSDLEVAKHMGVSRTLIVLLRAKEGIAPLPEGSPSKRDRRAVHKLGEEEIVKRMDAVVEGLKSNQGTATELIRKTNLTDSKRQHGGWKKVRDYVESKGVPKPKRRSPKKVDPSPSDSLSDPTHEAQVKKPSNQSDLMKREQLEGDMNG